MTTVNRNARENRIRTIKKVILDNREENSKEKPTKTNLKPADDWY